LQAFGSQTFENSLGASSVSASVMRVWSGPLRRCVTTIGPNFRAVGRITGQTTYFISSNGN
jgi:hypothetical protein